MSIVMSRWPLGTSDLDSDDIDPCEAGPNRSSKSPPDEAKHRELRRAGERAGETITRHVRDLAAAGIVHGDPRQIGHALWAASHGVIVLHLAGRLPRGMDVYELYFETMRLTFRGARTPSTRAMKTRKRA